MHHAPQLIRTNRYRGPYAGANTAHHDHVIFCEVKGVGLADLEGQEQQVGRPNKYNRPITYLVEPQEQEQEKHEWGPRQGQLHRGRQAVHQAWAMFGVGGSEVATQHKRSRYVMHAAWWHM